MTDVTFRPRFSLSPSIRAALDEIERNHWLVQNMLLMPQQQSWVRREITVARATATTKIEGIGESAGGISAEAARRAFAQALENALRAYEFIDYVSDLPEQPIDELVIRQINRDFLHGSAATLTPGVYRRGQNLVGNYTPPDQGDVPALMRAFVDWLHSVDLNDALKSGIAHLHLVAIHPFWDGNGRTARGIETLILQRSRLHFKKLLSIETRLLDVRQDYFAALAATLGSRFSRYDATPWLEFYASTLASEVQALVARLAEWHAQLDELHAMRHDAGILPRHADALAFAFRAGAMTRGDYIEITGVSPVTASRDLARLVEKGLLVADGRTSSRVYRPIPRQQSR
jgi:Fic family protein